MVFTFPSTASPTRPKRGVVPTTTPTLNAWYRNLPHEGTTLTNAAACSEYLRNIGQRAPISEFQHETTRKTNSLRRKLQAALPEGQVLDSSLRIDQLSTFLNGLLLQQRNLFALGKQLITYESYVSNIHSVILRLYRIHHGLRAPIPDDLELLLLRYKKTFHSLLPLSNKSVSCDSALISLAIEGLDQGSDTVSTLNKCYPSHLKPLCTNNNFLILLTCSLSEKNSISFLSYKCSS